MVRGAEAAGHGRAGGVLAAKQDVKPYPTRTNQIPRHIPPPHWASHPWVLFLAAGLLPYGTLFVELYFAMTSIWQARPHVHASCTAEHLSAASVACLIQGVCAEGMGHDWLMPVGS